MPIGNINTAKEQEQSPRPLLLATVTFLDGTVLRLATDGLRTADAGFQYAGYDWLPRILNQDIAAIQALSDGGIDIAPSVALDLNNADGAMWQHEIDRGWRGARLTLTFVFWTPGANDFSSDSITKFRGICGAPSVDETRLTVSARSVLALGDVQLPTPRIQPRCLHNFPRTAAERQAAADNEDSIFYGCGYSPDATGGNARGNLNGAVPFTGCNRTKEHCVARGMYTRDSANRVTGRFSGSQWDPPRSWRSRAYKPGSTWEEGSNTSNEAKYGDVIPLVWGRGWIEGKILNVVGEAASTRFEVLLGWGEFDSILRVMVNDYELPAATDMTGASLPVADALFRWNLVNRGDRNGAPNADAGYNGTGDPYGSLCVIECVVPRKVAESSAAPRVRVLAAGPRIRKYTNPTTYSTVGHPDHTHYAWILMDALIWAGLSYSDLDVQSFIDAAAVCAANVTFKDHDGATATQPRYYGSVVLDQRTSAAEVIRGLRNAGKMLLVANSDAAGKIKLIVEQTLADQQPAPVAGSNYNTAIASKTAAGVAANGYVAYDFSEANILRRGGKSTLRINPPGELPTRATVQFQDWHNNFSLDSETVVEVDSLVREGGKEVPGNIPLQGIVSHDAARRAIATYYAKRLYGNPRNAGYGDSGGTWVYEWETTFKAVRLQVGQICRLSYAQHGISNQLVRIERVQPSTNYEYVKIVARAHSDEWYLDTFGQEDSPRFTGSRRNSLARAPYPILGNPIAGYDDDPMYGAERFFGLYVQPDDTGAFRAEGSTFLPANTFPPGFRPPWCPAQGNTAPTGGGLAGGRSYYVEIVAHSAAGISAPSHQCRIDVPAGTATNTITVPDLDWHADATGYSVFVGTDPQHTIYQLTGSGTPSSITFAGPIDRGLADRPKPDPEFDFARWKVKLGRNLGVCSFEPTSCTATTITAAGAYWPTNEWAGRDVSLVALYDDQIEWQPGATWRVVSNTSNTLTLDPAYGPDPTVLMPFAGGADEKYLIVIRAMPTSISGPTVTDPKFDNVMALERTANAVASATNASPIVIEAVDHGYSTGDRIRIDYAAGNTAANGVWTITVIDADHFSLNSSAGNGAYTVGAIARRLTGGLSSDEAKGKLLRIIAGAGRGHVYKIASNTGTSITIEGDWITTPDATTRFITEEPDWLRIVDTSPANVDEYPPLQFSRMNLDLGGFSGRPLVVALVPVDGGGNEAPESGVQVRDWYIFHSLGTQQGEYQSIINLTVNGTLAIGSDQAARISLREAAAVRRVRLEVKQAPVGADLVVHVRIGPVQTLVSLRLPAGATEIASDLIAPDIPPDTSVRLDITSVGTTFPGADLSVSLYI